MRLFATSRKLTTKINAVRHGVAFSVYFFPAKAKPKPFSALLFPLKRNISEVMRLVAPNEDFLPVRSEKLAGERDCPLYYKIWCYCRWQVETSCPPHWFCGQQILVSLCCLHGGLSRCSSTHSESHFLPV